MIGQLLAFSRKQHLAPESVAINELVYTTADLLSLMMGTYIRVDVATQKDLWPALVDATQLELMVINLATNARDAMPEGGTLSIETTSLGSVLDERQPGLPVLFCSGYPDLIDKISQRINSGFALTKPYSTRELSAKLRSALRAKAIASDTVTKA